MEMFQLSTFVIDRIFHDRVFTNFSTLPGFPEICPSTLPAFTALVFNSFQEDDETTSLGTDGTGGNGMMAEGTSNSKIFQISDDSKTIKGQQADFHFW